MTERCDTPPGEALPASALPLPHEVLVWRGMKATPTVVLIDAFVVGDQLEKALIEETARRRRAEVLLFATQQAYVREHEASVVQSESGRITEDPHGRFAYGQRSEPSAAPSAVAPMIVPQEQFDAAKARVLCDWPTGEFRIWDDPDPHKPCFLVCPDGAMVGFSHHNGEGVDKARVQFIADACNAALAPPSASAALIPCRCHDKRAKELCPDKHRCATPEAFNDR